MAFTPALTASEMLYEAKVLYESIASADAPGYTNLQWSILLTRAQHNVVTRLWEEGYDKDEVHRGALSTLLTPTISTTKTDRDDIYTSSQFQAWEFTVDDDIMFTYSERCSYGNPIKYADVIPVEWDYYKMNVDNPFEQPDGTYFWGMVGSNSTPVYSKVILVPASITPLTLYTVGIHYPIPIVINGVTLQGVTGNSITGVGNCKLHSAIHRDIVEEAANLASAYSKDLVGYHILQNEMNQNNV